MDWTKKTFKQLAQERPERKKKDNSTKDDYFAFCRKCNVTIDEVVWDSKRKDYVNK